MADTAGSPRSAMGAPTPGIGPNSSGFPTAVWRLPCSAISVRPTRRRWPGVSPISISSSRTVSRPDRWRRAWRPPDLTAEVQRSSRWQRRRPFRTWRDTTGVRQAMSRCISSSGRAGWSASGAVLPCGFHRRTSCVFWSQATSRHRRSFRWTVGRGSRRCVLARHTQRPTNGPTPVDLVAFEGSYASTELGVEYSFTVRDRRLVLWHRKLGSIGLVPTYPDGFYGGGLYLSFRRDRANAVDGFTVSTPRAWKVEFDKLGVARP